MRRKSPNPALLLVLTLAMTVSTQSRAQGQAPTDVLLLQSQAEADRKSAGCVTCHNATDSATMHSTGTVRLGCTDCHGGTSDIRLNADAPKGSPPRLFVSCRPKGDVFVFRPYESSSR